MPFDFDFDDYDYFDFEKDPGVPEKYKPKKKKESSWFDDFMSYGSAESDMYVRPEPLPNPRPTAEERTPKLSAAEPESFWQNVAGSIDEVVNPRTPGTMAPSDIADAQIKMEARKNIVKDEDDEGKTIFRPQHKEEYMDAVDPDNSGVRKATQLFKDVGVGMLSTAQGMAGGAEWLTDGIIGGDLANQAKLWGQELSGEERDFGNQLAQGVGSMATFFVPGIGVMKGATALAKISPHLAKWMGAGTTTAIEAMTEAGSVYRDVLHETKDPMRATLAATETFTENVPLLAITNKLGMFGASGTAIKRALMSSMMEGSQEAGQEIISSTSAGKPIKWGDVATSAAIGGIIGGGTGMISHGLMPQMHSDNITDDQNIAADKAAASNQVPGNTNGSFLTKRLIENGSLDDVKFSLSPENAKLWTPEERAHLERHYARLQATESPTAKLDKTVDDHLQGKMSSTDLLGTFADEFDNLEDLLREEPADVNARKIRYGDKQPELDLGTSSMPLFDATNLSSPSEIVDSRANGEAVYSPTISNTSTINFADMVKEAARWKGAAINVDEALGEDKKARLAHSRITTKGDLDAYLMKKYGIDATVARSVSNELTDKNIPADRSAKAEDFADEPWAKTQGQDDLDTEASKYKTAKEFATAKVNAYHGTSSEEFDQFGGDVAYFTREKGEAVAFSENPIIGGGRGVGTPRVLEVALPEGKTKNIDDGVQEVVMEEHPDFDNLEEYIAHEAKIAREEGFDYLTFNHPSSVHGGEFEAIVAVNPKKVKTRKQLEEIHKAAAKKTSADLDVSKIVTEEYRPFSQKNPGSGGNYTWKRVDRSQIGKTIKQGPEADYEDYTIDENAAYGQVEVTEFRPHEIEARKKRGIDINEKTKTAITNSFELAPDLRGKGLGRKLWQKIEDDARKHGAERMEIWHVMSDATGFWRKMGFKPIAGGSEDARTWVKEKEDFLPKAKTPTKRKDTTVREEAGEYGIDLDRIPRPLNEAPKKADTFYSQMAQVLDKKLPNQGTPAQFRTMINAWAQKGEFKAEELKWSGVDEWLAGKKEKVTKKDVMDFIRENQIQIKEITKDRPAPHPGTNTTKYDSYQLPGGENYKELLLTLPERSTRSELDAEARKIAKTDGLDYDSLSEEEQRGYRRTAIMEYGSDHDAKVNYHSSHWSEPNVLLHVRMNDRIDADGKRILLLEEVQSDWHQEGRRRGYGQKEKYAVFSNARAIGEYSSREEAEAALEDAGGSGEIQDLTRPGVPLAPFSKTWHELGMKRMLRYAAENGYDRLAWTTGEQQAERYDLSKQLDAIEYSQHPIGYWLRATDKNDHGVLAQSYREEELPNVVGKELAEKIVSGVGVEVRPGKWGGVEKRLSGLDLKVGGEGMKGFYDKILPTFMNKYVKKWGAKVGETNIHAPTDFRGSAFGISPARDYQINDNRFVVVNMDNNNVAYGPADASECREWVRDAEGLKTRQTVHSVDITPQMRKEVTEKGQAFYEPKASYADKAIEQLGRIVNLYNAKGISGLGLFDRSKQSADRNAAGVRGKETRHHTVGKLVDDLKALKPVRLRGAEVKGWDDVYEALRITRNKNVEILQVLYIGEESGKILYNEACSSRLPGAVQIASPEILAAGIRSTTMKMERLSQENVRVVLAHNHPSGDVTASDADIAMTKNMAKLINRYGIQFDGHIVINHNKYNAISGKGDAVKRSIADVPAEYAKDPLLTIPVPHEKLGETLSRQDHVAAIAKDINRGDKYFTILMRSGIKVRGIVNVELGILDDPQKATEYIKELMVNHGAQDSFVYCENFTRDQIETLVDLVKGNTLRDAAWEGERRTTSLLEQGIYPDSRKQFGKDIEDFQGEWLEDYQTELQEGKAPYREDEGRGWFYNRELDKLEEIDKGDLGPNGDHDGWISIGDNAEKMGVKDAHGARAFQAATYGIDTEQYPQFEKWAEGGYVFTQDDSIADDPKFQRTFKKVFGTDLDTARWTRFPELTRVRYYPAKDKHYPHGRAVMDIDRLDAATMTSLKKMVPKLKLHPDTVVIIYREDGPSIEIPKSEFANVRNAYDLKKYSVKGVRENEAPYGSETDMIISQAKKNGTYMKAPNGQPTKLNPGQWAQVRTKAFKEWFGDWENDPKNASKVVDENGEPLLTYHGTNDHFSTFSKSELGKATGAKSASKGFFFVDNSLVPKGYTLNAAMSGKGDLIGRHNRARLDYLRRVEEETEKAVSKDQDYMAAESSLHEIKRARESYLGTLKNVSDGLYVPDTAYMRLELKYPLVKDYKDAILNEYRRIYSTKTTIRTGYDGNYSGDFIGQDNVRKLNESKKRIQDQIHAMVSQGLIEEYSKKARSVERLQTKEAFLVIKNPTIKDFAGSSYRDEEYSVILNRARRRIKGEKIKDGVILQNTFDGVADYNPGTAYNVFVVFSPDQIILVPEIDLPNPSRPPEVGGRVSKPTLVKDKDAPYGEDLDEPPFGDEDDSFDFGNNVEKAIDKNPEEYISIDFIDHLDGYIGTLRSLVIEGEPGKRTTDKDTGEAIWWSSTYPEFMQDQGWSQKEVLSALSHSIKGEEMTEKQREIVQTAINQAVEMFYEDLNRWYPNMTGKQYDKAEASIRKATDAFLSRYYTNQKLLKQEKEKADRATMITKSKYQWEKEKRQAENKAWEKEAKAVHAVQDQIIEKLQTKLDTAVKIRDQYRDRALKMLSEGKQKNLDMEARENATLNEIKKLNSKVEKLKASIEKIKTAKPKEAKKSIKAIIRISTGQNLDDKAWISKYKLLTEQIRREAMAARKAFSAGNREGLLAARTKYKMLQAQQRAMRDIRRETNKIVKDFKKVLKKTSEMTPEYANKIKSLLEDFDLSRMTGETRLKLEAIREALIENPDADIDERTLDTLKRLEKTPVRDISYPELKAMHDAVMHFATLGKRGPTMIMSQKAVMRDMVLKRSFKDMRPAKEVAKDLIPDATYSRMKSVRAQLAALRDQYGVHLDTYDNIVESLGGMQSMMYRVLYREIKRGSNERDRIAYELEDDFMAAQEAWQKRHPEIKDVLGWLSEEVEFARIRMNRNLALSLYRGWFDPDFQRSIIESGFGLWGSQDRDNPNKIFKVSGERYGDAVNKLSKAEREYADLAIPTINKSGDLLADKFLEINGYAMPRVEDIYWRKEVLASEREQDEQQEQLKERFGRPHIFKGMTKKRTGSSAAVWLKPYTVAVREMHKRAADYVGLEEAMNNAAWLMYNKEFKSEIEARYGLPVWREIEKGLKDIAEVTTPELSGNAAKFFRWLRNKSTVYALAANYGSMLKQLNGTINYMVYVDPGYIARAVRVYASNPMAVKRLHRQMSVEYRRRREMGYSQDIGNVLQVLNKQGLKPSAASKMGAVGLIPLQQFDIFGVDLGMLGATYQAMDAFKAGKMPDQMRMALDITDAQVTKLTPAQKMELAYRWADFVTQRTQNQNVPEHMSGWQRGGELEKQLSMFFGEMQKNIAGFARAYRAVKRGDPGAKALLLKSVLIFAIIGMAVDAGVNELKNQLRGRRGDKWWAAVLKSYAGYLPGIRDVAGVVIDQIQGRYYSSGGDTPYERVRAALEKPLGAGIGAINANTPRKQRDQIMKFTDGLANFFSMLAGIPYHALKEPIRIWNREDELRKTRAEERRRRAI